MPKTKVKKDEHGLYVRTGGYIFRPYCSEIGYNHVAIDDGNTDFIEGQEVNARHIGGSILGTIKIDDIKELWTSHGTYYDLSKDGAKTLKPNQVWKGN